MVVALLGASGHMGYETLKEFIKIQEVDLIKVLLEHKEKRNKLVKKLAKKYPHKIAIYYGDISHIDELDKVVQGSDYLFNLAAIIPPRSDKEPFNAYLANEVGVKNVVNLLEKYQTTKLIDITSIAVYGHRNEKHPFCRVGDPLMPSVFDVYGVHKLRGEFAILESKIPYFVILRQTAMIYLTMLKESGRGDGLIFHTCFNDPLEWVSAEDSALLLAGIIKEDLKGNLTYDNFWKKIFNIGGGESNRISGYQTIDYGFSLFARSAKDFFLPNYNVSRNFHGGYYYDGDNLNKLFNYQRDNIDDYWKKIKKKYPSYSLAKLAPINLIKKYAVINVFKDSNAPAYWYQHNDEARLTAFFGSKKEYESLSSSWNDFKLWDYKANRSIDKYVPIDYGFDIEKDDKDITLADLENVAKMHGGKLLSKDFKKGDVYTSLEWENSDQVRFKATPYTVLRGGHWINPLYDSFIWDFDRLCKKDKIFASYWYDSHSNNENIKYVMNDKYDALIIKGDRN